MVNYDRAVDIADIYMKAMTDGDIDAVMGLYAQNATFEDPVGDDIISGWDDIKVHYDGTKELDLKLVRTGPVRFANSEMAFPFTCEIRSADGSMLIEIIDHFVLNEEGLIVQMRAFWGPENTRQI